MTPNESFDLSPASVQESGKSLHEMWHPAGMDEQTFIIWIVIICVVLIVLCIIMCLIKAIMFYIIAAIVLVVIFAIVYIFVLGNKVPEGTTG